LLLHPIINSLSEFQVALEIECIVISKFNEDCLKVSLKNFNNVKCLYIKIIE